MCKCCRCQKWVWPNNECFKMCAHAKSTCKIYIRTCVYPSIHTHACYTTHTPYTHHTLHNTQYTHIHTSNTTTTHNTHDTHYHHTQHPRHTLPPHTTPTTRTTTTHNTHYTHYHHTQHPRHTLPPHTTPTTHTTTTHYTHYTHYTHTTPITLHTHLKRCNHGGSIYSRAHRRVAEKHQDSGPHQAHQALHSCQDTLCLPGNSPPLPLLLIPPLSLLQIPPSLVTASDPSLPPLPLLLIPPSLPCHCF